LLTLLCETPKASATSPCVAPDLNSESVKRRLIDTNSASSREPESGFVLGNMISYFFLLRAFESATLTVLGVVSHSAAISFGVNPARDNLPARSASDSVSGLTFNAINLIRISSLLSMRLVSLSLTGCPSLTYWERDASASASATDRRNPVLALTKDSRSPS
jgi:hypothetical protein